MENDDAPVCFNLDNVTEFRSDSREVIETTEL